MRILCSFAQKQFRECDPSTLLPAERRERRLQMKSQTKNHTKTTNQHFKSTINNHFSISMPFNNFNNNNNSTMWLFDWCERKKEKKKEIQLVFFFFLSLFLLITICSFNQVLGHFVVARFVDVIEKEAHCGVF
jgi:hypothetical protein